MSLPGIPGKSTRSQQTCFIEYNAWFTTEYEMLRSRHFPERNSQRWALKHDYATGLLGHDSNIAIYFANANSFACCVSSVS